MLGVAVDVYHVWWDPELTAQIKRTGKDRLLAYHVCDWLVPTKDLLLDRGMMGDGVIDLRGIREAGRGRRLCRLFGGRDLLGSNWWSRPMEEVLATCIERHRTVV